MSPWWVLVIVLVIGLLGWLSATANRLDGMHHRVELARESLNTQLARRIAAVLDLAGSGELDDPESVLLYDAAQYARQEDDDAAQSELSRAIRAVLDGTRLSELDESQVSTAELLAACRRVEPARRFYNDQVASARTLRGLPQVRWFKLAGRAAAPVTVDLDDTPPKVS